ncbi:MAG: UbiA family prenyltransferase [Clostridiales bacterium]|nr:UbiA family prenyltransferase [Clostridiales bacterium]
MIRRFLKYVEITTKITSLFAFAMTLSYLFFIGQPIDTLRTAVFFLGMFLFDLTTTAINNYIDTKTNHQQLQFKRSIALLIIYVLFVLSTACGLYLFYLTDVVVLVVGVLCFAFGVLYTYGPIPISRQPLGEIFSGFFYGFAIPFLVLYINMPEGHFLTFAVSRDALDLRLQIWPFVSLILLSIPPFCTTANIMLANNICDLEKDITVKRYTLPYYLGKRSLYVFAALYYLAFLSVVVMVVTGILSPLCLLSLVVLIPVQKNIMVFFKKQDKMETFPVAIKNYLLIMGTVTISIFLSGLFPI